MAFTLDSSVTSFCTNFTFALLTKIPIVICCSDYISEDNPHLVSQRWIERIHMAQAFVDCINRHFAFAEANSVKIAEVLENWLVEKGLK